jgi:chromosomal replication initiation ATPase DnaA
VRPRRARRTAPLAGHLHPRSAAAVDSALRAHGLGSLLDELCLRRGVPALDLCGRARSRSVARARQELWWTLRHLPEHDYSTSEIARMFQRHATTVLHGIAACERRRAEPPPIGATP